MRQTIFTTEYHSGMNYLSWSNNRLPAQVAWKGIGLPVAAKLNIPSVDYS